MGKHFTDQPKTSRKEQIKCSVCFDKIARATIQCSHKFCVVCIKRWAKKKPNCPLCRKSFSKVVYGKKEYTYQQPKEPRVAPRAPSSRVFIQPLLLSWNCVFYWKTYFCYQNSYPYAAPYFSPSYSQL